ncbi:hypothetical protein L2D00_07190 [Hyphomonadaceae bacterium BL14]|nr:hypothetical protein L2D00_07190 [Hyphomonadaceae bacterium BL14]
MNDVTYFSPFHGFLSPSAKTVWAFEINENVKRRILSLTSNVAIVLYAMFAASALLWALQDIVSPQNAVGATFAINTIMLATTLYVAILLIPQNRKVDIIKFSTHLTDGRIARNYYIIFAICFFIIALNNTMLARHTQNEFAVLAVAISLFMILFGTISAAAYLFRGLSQPRR